MHLPPIIPTSLCNCCRVIILWLLIHRNVNFRWSYLNWVSTLSQTISLCNLWTITIHTRCHFAVAMRGVAFSISVHRGHAMPVLLKAMIQIFKNSLFRFITYPITVSLTLFLHPFQYPFPSSLTCPYPAFLVGKGPERLMKIWRGSESTRTHEKTTVTKIERDQIGRHHPSPHVFQGCMGRVPWVPYGGCA